MAAHQCPRCPLLFSYRTEVQYHLATDHRVAEPPPATSREAEAVGSAGKPAARARGKP